MLDKKKIKEKLEKERDILLEEMRDMGKLNPETGDWEATPEAIDVPESDQNDMADRIERYEAPPPMKKGLVHTMQKLLPPFKNLHPRPFSTLNTIQTHSQNTPFTTQHPTRT